MSRLIPDSVGIDRDATHNPSAAKSMGFCLGVDIAQRCFEGRLSLSSNDVRERKMTLKFHSRTPSLLQDCTSLPAFSV